MKISIEWLKQYVAISIPAEKLAHRLTLAGLEVEKIEHLEGDAAMELEITPNRPDCLNMLGIARELSAILNKPLKYPKIRKIPTPKEKCSVEILDREGCSRYVGAVVKDVKVEASPQWLQQRLLAVGLRPINNIVDITNFVMMETGQPLHAFDYDRLEGNRIIVRRARAGEKMKTLDGVERVIDSSILVIADAQKAVALAGIMGGEASEVSAGTKNILLESAYFNPIVIRRGARKLGVSTDASYRFERGVDIEKTDTAAGRALGLIKEIAGGNVCRKNDVYPTRTKQARPQVAVSVPAIAGYLGSAVTTRQCRTILKKLEFKVTAKGKDGLVVVPPSFRNDIKRPEDIVEEVARVIGYDHLSQSLPQIKACDLPLSRPRQIKEKIRQVMTGLGFSEITTFTMIHRGMLEKTLEADLAACKIQNPLTQDQEVLRPAVLPSFLQAALLNLNRGQRDLKFFELAKIFSHSGEEQELLAVMLAGEGKSDWRLGQKRAGDFYDLKGTMEAVIHSLGQGAGDCEAAETKIFAPGEAAVLKIANQEIGCLGKVNPEILKRWDIKHTDVFYGQIDAEFFYRQKPGIKKFAALPNFPSVSRDISLAVKPEVGFAQIQKTVKKTGGELLAGVSFRELYLGEKIPAGHRGYIFSLTYQSRERTLTEDEVNQAHRRVVEALVTQYQAVIR